MFDGEFPNDLHGMAMNFVADLERHELLTLLKAMELVTPFDVSEGEVSDLHSVLVSLTTTPIRLDIINVATASDASWTAYAVGGQVLLRRRMAFSRAQSFCLVG